MSFPNGFIDLYFEREDYNRDVILKEFEKNLAPINWSQVAKRHGKGEPGEVLLLEDYNIVDGWTHGTFEPAGKELTTFSFAGPKAEQTPRIEAIITFGVPFLVEVCKRILKHTPKFLTELTRKEIEVLKWIKEGKSSWEISTILNCSKRTADFHFENIKRKLNAVTRAQAVAIGLHFGIIDF